MEQVAQQAKAMGYQGVELRTLGPGSTGLACDPALMDPATTRDIFKANGIQPLCLSTSTSVHARDNSAAMKAHWQVVRDLELAAQIGCQYIRVFGAAVEPGESRQSAIQHIAQRAQPLVEQAGRLGVQVLFENAGNIACAKEWWWLFNMVDHPMLGLCWNVANAAAAGELASVSVPTLHSRIQIAKVKDTHLGQGSGFVPLGEGTVGIQPFIQRLLGIGYDRYLSVEWDRLWLPSLAPAQEYLPQAHQQLTDWLDQIAQAVEKGKVAAAKAAAKLAPKPKKVSAV